MSKLKKKLLKKPKDRKFEPSDFLSTGHIPLNLALTGRIHGGLVKGKYVNMIGDSDTGKTIVALEILAQACSDPEFKDFALIFVNAEHSNLIDLSVLHPDLPDRIEIIDNIDSPEGFYYFAWDRLKKEKCIIVCDSMDALMPRAEEKKIAKQKKAFDKGEKTSADTLGTKAKLNAGRLNKCCSLMDKNGSILLIISQARDNIQIGPFAFGPKKARSGGTAMKFYNRMEIWLSHPKQIKAKYKGNSVQIGSVSNVKIEKNHITGKKRSVTLTVYNDYGVDDIGDCIDFLLKWKHWKGNIKTGTNIKATEFDFQGSKEKLIKKIEKKKSRIRKIHKLVGGVWKEIEKSVALKRRPKWEAY